MMSINDRYRDASKKDTVQMKQDIIYKLDDTNSVVTIVRGVVGAIGQDVKVMKSQLKTMDLRLEGIDMHLTSVEERLTGVEDRLTGQDKKLDQILQQLTLLTNKSEG
jgi:uncharacterized coiled-coil protein SlyX